MSAIPRELPARATGAEMIRVYGRLEVGAHLIAVCSVDASIHEASFRWCRRRVYARIATFTAAASPVKLRHAQSLRTFRITSYFFSCAAAVPDNRSAGQSVDILNADGPVYSVTPEDLQARHASCAVENFSP